MRRIGTVFLVLFLLVAAALPAQAARRTIALGDLGDDVAELQAILARLGFSPGPVDGDFGYRTAEAVQQFQARQQLAVDGIVGPATWRALDQALADPSQPAATNRSGASFYGT